MSEATILLEAWKSSELIFPKVILLITVTFPVMLGVLTSIIENQSKTI